MFNLISITTVCCTLLLFFKNLTLYRSNLEFLIIEYYDSRKLCLPNEDIDYLIKKSPINDNRQKKTHTP